MAEIHPSALVADPHGLPDDVVVGPFSIIEKDVALGRRVWIDSHVSIKSGARIGDGCRIYHGAALAGPPQDLKYAGEETQLVVGANCTIREFVTMNRGTVAHGRSEIGDNCLFMAYSHVAHDCIIGSNVIIANTVEMGGHVVIGDYAIIGGGTVIHQFCHIGEHAMIGGGFRVTQDVIPYSLAAGYPLRCLGLNYVGLKRRGFSANTLAQLKHAFHLLLSCKLKTSDALKRIQEEVEPLPEVRRVVEFIERSERGVVK